MKNLMLTALLPLLASGCAWTTNLDDGARLQTVTSLFAPSIAVYEVPQGYRYRPYVVGGQSVVSQMSGPISAAVIGPFMESGLKGSGNRLGAGAAAQPLSPQSIGIRNNIKVDSTNINFNSNDIQLGDY